MPESKGFTPAQESRRLVRSRLTPARNIPLGSRPPQRQHIPYSCEPTFKFELRTILVIDKTRKQKAFTLTGGQASVTGRRRHHALLPKPGQKRWPMHST